MQLCYKGKKKARTDSVKLAMHYTISFRSTISYTLWKELPYQRELPLSRSMWRRSIRAAHLIGGIHIISMFLQTMDKSHWPLNQFILNLLEHILNTNVFLYAGFHYLQVQGVAIGTFCAPSYANSYLGGWEQQLFAREDLSMYLCHILLWHRYVKDILMVWTGPLTELKIFLDKLEENTFNLHFTHAVSNHITS